MLPSIDILDYKRISVLSPEPQVLGVGGSPRKAGNSDVLLKYILAGVSQRKLATHNVQLRAFQFQACIGCEKCRRAKVKHEKDILAAASQLGVDLADALSD